MADEPVDHEGMVFDRLTGKYKHYCMDWDGMAMDETWPEFETCTCFPPSVYIETAPLRAEALAEIEKMGQVDD